MQQPKNKNIFRRSNYNRLAPAAINQLKEKVRALEGQVKDTATEHVEAAREDHSSAYEPWRKAEEKLLCRAMDFTNDLGFLSQCFSAQ
jgi:hypothetical protein